MQPNPLVANAATETANAVRGVKADKLGAPTPCRDWDVRTLTNHLLQVICALNAAGSGEALPDEWWQRDLMSDDWAARFDDEARRAIAAWADPAAWQGAVSMGSTEMPATLVATMLASDLVIHGWDLARATGQDYRCDAAAAEMTYRFIADTGEQGRGMGIYAEPVPVPDDAPTLDRALGLSGRDPQWAPSPR
jgi:uncharacterized protein (TIGR03086 family)